MSDRFLAATRKGLFRVARGAGGWKIDAVRFLGDNVTLVHPDPRDGTLLAALDHGHFGVKLHRSADAGNTWKEIAAPAYPAKPSGLEHKDAWGREIDWKLKLVWAFASGAAGQPGRVYAGTLPGGLFVSDDGGDSWRLNEPLWAVAREKKWMGGGADQPGIHSISVDPRNADRIAAGVSCGGVWVTEDGGSTWKNRANGMRAAYTPPDQAMNPDVQDPHLVVQCPGAPERWWAQHHNGIFRSTDDLGSWVELQDVRPSPFGFPVAVHPRDGDTAWFVPATKDEKRIPVDGRVVVNRTRDGGKTFETLSRGLPQEHAYDLVFRHALDIDRSGRRLAFGSTTGSVWVSEDEGDSWAHVSAHLPPVFAVRFLRE